MVISNDKEKVFEKFKPIHDKSSQEIRKRPEYFQSDNQGNGKKPTVNIRLYS